MTAKPEKYHSFNKVARLEPKQSFWVKMSTQNESKQSFWVVPGTQNEPKQSFWFKPSTQNESKQPFWVEPSNNTLYLSAKSINISCLNKLSQNLILK